MRDGGGTSALGKAAAIAYRWRVWLLCAGVFAVMGAIEPKFLTARNFADILKGVATNLPAAIGFTIVLLAGQLDLSVGSAMTLGGMLVMGLAPELGWAGAFAVAVSAGVVLGLANGLLVARAKINSFIVTLGAMIIVYNAMAIYCKGGTIATDSFAMSDWFGQPLIGSAGAAEWTAWLTLWLTPRNLIPLAILAAASLMLRRTPLGRGFYLLGGNPQTAWYSGLRVDGYLVGAFVLSASLSALGGSLVAMSEAAGSLKLGENSLMAIVAAAIIGGTSMEGGKGSVIGTAVALVALTALINGLSCLGAGHEIKLMASGLVLAMVILYDAYWLYLKQRTKGQRRDLLLELKTKGAPT